MNQMLDIETWLEMLVRNMTAQPGAVPESHGQRRVERILPKAFLLPDTRQSCFRAFPGQMILGKIVNLLVCGNLCLH